MTTGDKTYFIRDDYVHRNEQPKPTDPSEKIINSEKFQREVYQKARHLAEENQYKKILDIGTGSGYKLMKYFSEYDTLGTDVSKTVQWLRNQYPDRHWTDSMNPINGYNLIICADVIEHIVDPDQLLDMIEQCDAEMIVISTVARDLNNKDLGPPKNLHHCREWTQQEFAKYIGSRFNIIEHYVSSKKKRTQLIVATNQ